MVGVHRHPQVTTQPSNSKDDIFGDILEIIREISAFSEKRCMWDHVFQRVQQLFSFVLHLNKLIVLLLAASCLMYSYKPLNQKRTAKIGLFFINNQNFATILSLKYYVPKNICKYTVVAQATIYATAIAIVCATRNAAQKKSFENYSFRPFLVVAFGFVPVKLTKI